MNGAAGGGGGDGGGSGGKRSRHGGGAPSTDSGTDTAAHTAPKRRSAAAGGGGTATNDAMAVRHDYARGRRVTWKGLQEELDSEGGRTPHWWKFQMDTMRRRQADTLLSHQKGATWMQTVQPSSRVGQCLACPQYIPRVSISDNQVNVYHTDDGLRIITVMRDKEIVEHAIAYDPTLNNNLEPSDKQVWICAVLMSAYTDVRNLKSVRDLTVPLDSIMHIQSSLQLSGEYTIALGNAEDAFHLARAVIIWQTTQYRMALRIKRPSFTEDGLLRECEQHFQKQMGYKGCVLTPLLHCVYSFIYCVSGDNDQPPCYYAKALQAPAPAPPAAPAPAAAPAAVPTPAGTEEAGMDMVNPECDGGGGGGGGGGTNGGLVVNK